MARDRNWDRKDDRYERRRSRSPDDSRESYSRRYRDRDFRDREQWRRRSDHRARSRSRSKSEPEWDTKKQIQESKAEEIKKKVASPAIDAAAIAASAAARINALISSKKLAQENDAADRSASPVIPGTSSGNEEVSKPLLVRTVNINDLRNKYLLTKPDTQEKISKETNTKVTTGGRYYPDSSLSTEANPPLHVRVEADNEEALEKALEKIDELINQELGDLIDQKRLGLMRKGGLLPEDLATRGLPTDRRLTSNRLLEGPVANNEMAKNEISKEADNTSIVGPATATISPQPSLSESPIPLSSPRHQADIPIRLDRYIRPFQARGVVVGQGGANVKHIQNETGVRVQVKGRGSGFLDKITGKEDDRDMYLHVYRGTAEQIQKAKELCEDLVNTMCQQYESGSDKPASGTKTNETSRVPIEMTDNNKNPSLSSGPPGLKVNMTNGVAPGPPGFAPGPPGFASGPPGLALGISANQGVPPPPPPSSNIAFQSADASVLSSIQPPLPPPPPPMGVPAPAPPPPI